MRSSSSVPLSGKNEPAASAGEQNAPPVRVISQPSLTTFIQGAAFGFLACLLFVGLFALLTRHSDPPPIVLQPPPTPLPSPTALPTTTPASLVVFVSGAVVAPGLYTLPPEARVGDALSAAGGLTAAAAAAAVNQAEHLWDGAQIHVPVQSAPAVLEPVAGVSGAAAVPAVFLN